MKILHNDLNLRLQRREDDFYGVDFTKENSQRSFFLNLSPGTQYVFTDGIGIWTTEEKPPGFSKFRKLEKDKMEIVFYNLNRANLKSITLNIKGVMHPEQENWAKYWIGSSIHGEERVRILESPEWRDEILINDAYFRIFEMHLAGLRKEGKFILPVDKQLYRLALGQYERSESPPALLLLKFSEPQKINERFIPEYFIEGYISLIKAGNGFRKRS
jgi:hypothetical protein